MLISRGIFRDKGVAADAGCPLLLSRQSRLTMNVRYCSFAAVVRGINWHRKKNIDINASENEYHTHREWQIRLCVSLLQNFVVDVDRFLRDKICIVLIIIIYVITLKMKKLFRGYRSIYKSTFLWARKKKQIHRYANADCAGRRKRLDEV